jgi:excisionase family DNA binding protein
MEATSLKPFLTVKEAAEYIGRGYMTVRDWVVQGRVASEQREAGKKTFYRVRREEAERVKAVLESGLWV